MDSLHVAISKGREWVERLLDHKADVNAVNEGNDNKTPLHYACEKNGASADVVMFLLHNGATTAGISLPQEKAEIIKKVIGEAPDLSHDEAFRLLA